MTLRTRKPSGIVPWPFLLVEGPEKSGKSWMVAELSASPRISRTYWLELGSEGTADQYGSIPGSDYEIVEHNGTWPAVVQAIKDVRAEGEKALAAGEPPVMLVIDSATAEWALLTEMAEKRARNSNYGKKILASDKNADVPIDRGHWNYVGDQHYLNFIEPLKRFPGIAVVTARGKEISGTDAGGKPTNAKEYRVEGHKNIGFDVHAWIRLSRTAAPTVVGMRSVVHPIRPGVDKPVQDADLTLEKFIFDILGCDPATATTVDMPTKTELEEAKAALWAKAQERKWSSEKLAAVFAEQNGGMPIGEATARELNQLREHIEQLPEES